MPPIKCSNNISSWEAQNVTQNQTINKCIDRGNGLIYETCEAVTKFN